MPAGAGVQRRVGGRPETWKCKSLDILVYNFFSMYLNWNSFDS